MSSLVVILLPAVGYLISQVLLIEGAASGKVFFVAICALMHSLVPMPPWLTGDLSQRYQLHLPDLLSLL